MAIHRHVTILLVLACCVCVVVSCRSARERELLSLCEKLQEANVRDDVESMVQKGDLRPVGVYGIALEAPGFPWPRTWEPSELRMIEGTSDAPESEAEIKLNRIAREYANEYNRYIFPHLPQGRYVPPVVRIYSATEELIAGSTLTERDVQDRGTECVITQIERVQQVAEILGEMSTVRPEQSGFSKTDIELVVVKRVEAQENVWVLDREGRAYTHGAFRELSNKSFSLLKELAKTACRGGQ